jgi:hypothetical protein
MEEKWVDKIVVWYNMEANSYTWRLATNEEELKELEESARQTCERFFGVMIFSMNDVLNKG